MAISEVSVKELLELSGVQVVDVREPDEYVDGHVPGAISIPLSELQARVAEFPTDGVVYVICQAGVRSQKACEFLHQQSALSSTTFINVAGGTGMWILEGGQVVNGDRPS